MDFIQSNMEVVPSNYFDGIEFKDGKYQRFREKEGIIQVKIKNNKESSNVQTIENNFYYLICDKYDFNIVNNYKWYPCLKDYSNTVYLKNSKGTTLHIAIKGIPPEGKPFIDHINRNGLDNRRCNLRFVTKSENALNHPVRLTNKSGYPGVIKSKGYGGRSDSWCAYIKINGKNKESKYSIDKYGEEKAKELAILKRKEFEKDVVIYESPCKKVEDKPELKEELNHSLKGVYKKDNNGSSSWYAEHNPIIDGKRKTVKVSFGIKKYSEEGAKKMAVLAKEILKCKFSDKEIPDKLSLESRDILKKDGFWIVFYLFYRDYKAEFSIEKFGEEGAKQLALLARNIFKSIEEQRNKNGEFVGVTLKTRKSRSDYWYAHVNYNGSIKTESYSLSSYNNPKQLAIKKRKQFVEYFISKLPSA